MHVHARFNKYSGKGKRPTQRRGGAEAQRNKKEKNNKKGIAYCEEFSRTILEII